MRVMLLSAGFGTRLRPLTDNMPKCLVPIKGQPLLQIWLERLSSIGLGPFLINTHYLADKVSSFITTSQFCDQVTLFHEKNLLGTAGTLMVNLDFFQGKDGSKGFSPRIMSRREPDGKMVSPDLDDMHPFLSRDELDAERRAARGEA